MRIPKGFRFSGIQAGIKPNRRDLAMVLSDVPSVAAACFTANKAKAAPILDAEARLPAAGARAVVINSGNANAITGNAGLEDVRKIRHAVGSALLVAPDAVFTASTGVIGVRLPAAKIVDAIPKLIAGLSADPVNAAEAIMTTDTRVKMASRTVNLGGTDITLSAICKGSGMIAPQLATMIAVVTTDCAINAGALSQALRQAMRTSFNSLTVDNDMSTNDVVFALANGLAGNRPLTDPGEDVEKFTQALTEICEELAREIATDGEGATKSLEIIVRGGPSWEISQDIAKSIAGSSLVKAAFFGADPNWGRILATVGARAGSQEYPVDPFQASVSIQGLCVYDREPVPHDALALKGKMRSPEVRVEVELRSGDATARAWGCDLSYDYVKINADYTSLIVQKPDGAVAKDDRLANYSPAFKVSLLVEALSYISRFAGKRCVIKYGGAAMIKEGLKQSFCDDINLLRNAGLHPIVVHGGGPEITRTLDKLGSKTEFVDGIRVTNASDLKVVEMVLTGAINTEIVTRLNKNKAMAVGVSGKDGGLIRAKKHLHEHGRDLGQVGDITYVNASFLELLLQQNYVPVISPIGLGEDGQSYNINADAVAAEVASAVHASKLIYLTDVPGLLKAGELISEIRAPELNRQLGGDNISGGMKVKVASILKAVAAGVEQVHIIDGRTPHSVIAELFTNHGVGTLITA